MLVVHFLFITLFLLGSEASAKASLPELFETTGNAEAASRLEKTFPGLFPSKVTAWTADPTDPNSIAQNLIDQTLVEIISTRTGKDICTVLRDESEISDHLGASKASAKRISEICGSDLGKDLNEGHRIVGRAFPRVRSWTFLRTDQPQFLVTSWTTPLNESALLFHSSSNWKEQLTRLVAHEIAVYFDGNYRVTLGWWKNSFGDTAKLLERNGKELDTCVGLKAISDYSISMGALVARALSWEAKIFQELFTSSKDVPVEYRQILDPKIPCSDKLQALTVSSLQYSELLPNLLRNSLRMEGRTDCPKEEIKKGKYNPNRVLPNLRELRNWIVHTSDDAKIELACFLITPRFSRDNIYLNHGPRPNLTGGIGVD